MSKICCGMTYSDNDKFCRVCGKKLDAPQTPVAPQPMMQQPMQPQAPVAPQPMMQQPMQPQAPVAPQPMMQQPMQPQAPVAPQPMMQQPMQPQAPVAPQPMMQQPMQPQAPVAPQPQEPAAPVVEKKVEEEDEPGTSVLTADMMGPIDHSKDNATNNDEEEELGTSVLTADMMGPIDHSKDNAVNMNNIADEPGTSILAGGIMGQPIPGNNPPMNGPMMGQPMMGQNPQQGKNKAKKANNGNDKVSKALGIVSMVVAGVGLVAIGVLLFFFVIKPSFKKYEGVADQGLRQDNQAVATVIDATSADATTADTTVQATESEE